MRPLAIAFLVILSLSYLAYIRTDGFSPSLIQGTLFAHNPAPLSTEGKKALSQPFHYLSKGRQCFVFESADGKYVLKFFNQKYFKMPWYAFFSAKEKEKRALRRHFYENSYEIAFRESGDGILYLHLGHSDPLPTLIFKDKASREYKINLTSIPFVLQRKGIPIYTALDTIYQTQGIEGICREIDLFVQIIAARIEKKIADGDQDVEHNWGYLDGHIFHLDPGRLYYDPQLAELSRIKTEWDTATRKFHKWLKIHYPEAAKYLENQLPASLETTSNLPGSSKRCVAPSTISNFFVQFSN